MTWILYNKGTIIHQWLYYPGANEIFEIWKELSLVEINNKLGLYQDIIRFNDCYYLAVQTQSSNYEIVLTHAEKYYTLLNEVMM